MMSPVGWECTQGSAETKTLKKGGDMAVNWLMSNDKKGSPSKNPFWIDYKPNLTYKPNLSINWKKLA